VPKSTPSEALWAPFFLHKKAQLSFEKPGVKIIEKRLANRHLLMKSSGNDVTITLPELVEAPTHQPRTVLLLQPFDALGQFLGKQMTVEANLGQNALAVFQHFHKVRCCFEPREKQCLGRKVSDSVLVSKRHLQRLVTQPFLSPS
jgi:hypothetical protein